MDICRTRNWWLQQNFEQNFGSVLEFGAKLQWCDENWPYVMAENGLASRLTSPRLKYYVVRGNEGKTVIIRGENRAVWLYQVKISGPMGFFSVVLGCTF